MVAVQPIPARIYSTVLLGTGDVDLFRTSVLLPSNPPYHRHVSTCLLLLQERTHSILPEISSLNRCILNLQRTAFEKTFQEMFYAKQTKLSPLSGLQFLRNLILVFLRFLAPGMKTSVTNLTFCETQCQRLLETNSRSYFSVSILFFSVSKE